RYVAGRVATRLGRLGVAARGLVLRTQLADVRTLLGQRIGAGVVAATPLVRVAARDAGGVLAAVAPWPAGTPAGIAALVAVALAGPQPAVARRGRAPGARRRAGDVDPRPNRPPRAAVRHGPGHARLRR